MAAADENERPPPSRPTVVVGLDGSVPGHAAVTWAADLVRRLRGRLVVVHAVESLVGRPVGPGMVDVEWMERIVAADVDLTLELVTGEHAERLRAAAEREHAFLVVIGTDPSHGTDTYRRITAGTDRPVVLVPRDAPTPVRDPAGPWSLSTGW